MICNMCPRRCGVNRKEKQGFCLSPEKFRVARAALHFWEEPCISGKRGSGTVFVSGCNLKCVYCQNSEISIKNKGTAVSSDKLIEIFEKLIAEGAENINLVNPTHYAVQLKELFEKYAVENRWDSKETIYVKRCLQTALPEKLRNIISSHLFKAFVTDSEEKFAYELYMNRDQIRCMKNAGMYIGLHGYDHYWLGNLEEKYMEKDIDRSLEALDEFITPENRVMNYPYGSFNENVIAYIKKQNCVMGLSTELGRANLEIDDRYKLPRFDTNDFPPKSKSYLRF